MAAAKPKIDLKARLGRKSGAPSAAPPPAQVPTDVSSGASGIPPAAFPSGADASAPGEGLPAAAPPVLATPSQSPLPGLSTQPAPGPVGAAVRREPAAAPSGFGGISVPPPRGFGVPSTPAAPAAIPGSLPTAAAAIPAAPIAAAPLQIRMDMGEEVIAARKAGRKKTMMLALSTAVIGMGLGFVIGQGVKGNEGAAAAIEGAQSLITEIDKANQEASKLEDLLKKAFERVSAGEYPSSEIEALGGLDIPFDGSNLVGKGIGRFNQTAVTLLLQYTNAVERTEAQRDKVRRLFGAVKTQFETVAAEKTAPKAHWGAVVASGPKGPWIKLTPLDPAFELGKDWPSELAKVHRYTKGDLSRGDAEALPVDPSTESQVCPNNFTGQLQSALYDLRLEINGDTRNEARPVKGLLDLGNDLSDQLRKIGGPG